jgi:hypothetical protein
MQDRTWNLTLTDGANYEALSQQQAGTALDRIMHGLEPVSQQPQTIVAERFADDHELALAA